MAQIKGMKTFNSANQFYTWLIGDLLNFEKDQLAQEIKLIYNKHIKTDVYDAYEPTAYQRRGAYGGLLTFSDLKSEAKVNGYNIQLTVTNETPGNDPIHSYFDRPTGTQLMNIVETGKGYEVWHNAFPRPATHNAAQEIRETSLLENKLRKRYHVLYAE